jgi:hypothetical protein
MPGDRGALQPVVLAALRLRALLSADGKKTLPAALEKAGSAIHNRITKTTCVATVRRHTT